MSYAGMMEDELTEQCVCGKSYEDHGARWLCECGHYCDELSNPQQQSECEDECTFHTFRQDEARYCDWSKSGEVFRRREPNDGA